MNGIKFKHLIILLLGIFFFSCEKLEPYKEPVFVYEPVGRAITVAQLKQLPVDALIEEELYVQGTVTSSDAEGNFARQILFQDGADGMLANIDMATYNKEYPYGKSISVQLKGLFLAQINGVLQLASGVSGSGIFKVARAIDNRTVRSHFFAYGDAPACTPQKLTLSQLDAQSRTAENMLVELDGLFFQTTALPFANAGGSSSQNRTLYNTDGLSLLLSTNDASTMAAEMLTKGSGSVTGILSYPNGRAQIVVKSIDDIRFDPSVQPEVSDPEDRVSKLIISEYFSSLGKSYIELYNCGNTAINMGEYSLSTDTQSDGVFSSKVDLENQMIAPQGVVLYKTSASNAIPWVDTEPAAWQPLRTNYSCVRLDALQLDGNSQIALMKGSEVADILATTGKSDWAHEVTLIRRTNIEAHSKSSDFTRADAGWITKVGGYSFNLGHHRFFDTDPDLDAPTVSVVKSILNVRSMESGKITEAIKIVGVVTSDRESGNVAPNRLYMQDASNRGLCVAFREGQQHLYNAGDEVAVELYGASLVSENGLYVITDASVSRSVKTDKPNAMPNAIEASVAQLESLQSMYVFVKDVQIKSEELSKTYGTGAIASEDLFANQFNIVTASSASFASSQVSDKSGSVKGIATVGGASVGIMPRNANDLYELSDERFIAITATPISVSELRTNPSIVSTNVRVTCSVVSDFSNGNFMAQNIAFVQDAQSGFMLKLPVDNPYQFGQSLIVVLQGAAVTTTNGQFIVEPANAKNIVAVGAPDPALLPVTITSAEINNNLYRLVTLQGVQVSEADRMKSFAGSLSFDVSGTATKLTVISQSSASWSGSYLPNAKGDITGLITYNGTALELYPRSANDIASLPTNGKRLNGESVVYFVPSNDPNADLMISEAVMGNVDANGNPVSSIARNNCNAKFVELHNPSANTLTLSNYRVACIKYNNSVSRGDIAYYQFPEGHTLAPGKTIVFKYLSLALGTGTTNKQTNTLWPVKYTGDSEIKSGVEVSTTASPGVLVCFDARDYLVGIANSTKSFAAFDGNDLLVVQKSSDGGASWREIDRLFTLQTTTGVIGGGVAYKYLTTYRRRPATLGCAGNITDVSNPDYTALVAGRNNNDFSSTQCDPLLAQGGGLNWFSTGSYNDIDDLGVHTFSVKP